jgi:ubiquinone/menaquinone biosynthesis C-methylase UbiE
MEIRKLAFGLLFLYYVGLSFLLIAQTNLEETWEKDANKRQPADKVMDTAGVKPGMIIGEIGAGRGRYTVHLAQRVGDEGRIYANDINPTVLEYLKERCRKNGIANIETVLGKVDDPLFPRTGLDMIFMVWTYHMMEKPVEMLRSLVPYLKPGAAVVMVEPVPADTESEIKEETARLGKKPSSINVVSEDSVRRDAAAAGFEFVRMDSSLTNDNIFILKPKTGAV